MQHQHYKGLIAEWYDDWLKEYTGDIDYYSAFFKGFEGRVLELACGTGRVLIPIAQTGVKIDGLDTSEDMLAILQKKASELGLNKIDLHKQSMEDFDLEEKYDAIFVATGSFQLLTKTEGALSSLHCVHQHLTDTGFFMLDLFIPWDNIIDEDEKDGQYRVTRDRSRPDGSRSIVLERYEIDIPKQLKLGTYKYEFYEGNHLAHCVADELPIRWYWKDEFLSLLHDAGFSEVEIMVDATLYDEGYAYVFKASK